MTIGSTGLTLHSRGTRHRRRAPQLDVRSMKNWPFIFYTLASLFGLVTSSLADSIEIQWDPGMVVGPGSSYTKTSIYRGLAPSKSDETESLFIEVESILKKYSISKDWILRAPDASAVEITIGLQSSKIILTASNYIFSGGGGVETRGPYGNAFVELHRVISAYVRNSLPALPQ